MYGNRLQQNEVELQFISNLVPIVNLEYTKSQRLKYSLSATYLLKKYTGNNWISQNKDCDI